MLNLHSLSRAFTPGHASTETNLERRLSNINVAGPLRMDEEEDNNLNGLLAPVGTAGDMVERMQKNLSGETQAVNNVSD